MHLIEQIEPDIEVKIILKELCHVSLQFKGEGLFEFLEFISIHPPMAQSKEQKSRFYSMWMDKISIRGTQQPVSK